MAVERSLTKYYTCESMIINIHSLLNLKILLLLCKFFLNLKLSIVHKHLLLKIEIVFSLSSA